jgi:hypothetical protein
VTFIRLSHNVIRHELSAFRLCEALTNSFAGLLIKRYAGCVSWLAFGHGLQDSRFQLEVHGP